MREFTKHYRKSNGSWYIDEAFSDGSKNLVLRDISTREGADKVLKTIQNAYHDGYSDAKDAVLEAMHKYV